MNNIACGEKKSHSSFRLLNILHAEKRKAELIGKHNHSRIGKRYKVAGYIEEIATYIHLRV